MNKNYVLNGNKNEAHIADAFLFSVRFIAILYAAMTIASSVIAIDDGYYGMTLEGLDYRVNVFDFIVLTIISVVSIFCLYNLSNITSKLKLISLDSKDGDTFINVTAVFVVFGTFLSTFVGGAGTIQRGSDSHRLAELFFALINPYIFIPIFLYYAISSGILGRVRLGIFLFCLFSYVFLILNSGFSGFLFFVIPVICIFIRKFFGIRLSFALGIFLIALIPFLRVYKWFVIVGVEEFDLNIFDFEVVMYLIQSSIDRFSLVHHAAFIHSYLSNSIYLLDSQYQPFFQGYPGSLLYKTFSGSPPESINLLLHYEMSGSFTDSNSHFPLLSYLSIDVGYGILYVFYSMLMTVLLVFILRIIFSFGKKINTTIVHFLVFYCVFIYIYHGWFWEAASFIQSAFIFMLVFIFSKMLRPNFRGVI